MEGFQLVTLGLEKTLLFKNVEFEFKKGLTAVYGLNKASTRTSNNGNGAGKSAFFSQLGEVLYDNPVVGEKQDTIKSGQRTIRGTLNDKKIEIRRDNKKLDIKINGKSKFRTKPLAQAWLRKHFPISEEDFQTYVHLDARIPHPLVMGKSAERKKFFTSFFNLDKLDIERKLFMAELSRLSKIRAAYNEVRSEYKIAKEKTESENLDALRTKIRECRTRLDELNAKNKKLQGIMQLLAFERTAKPQIDAFTDICQDTVGQEEFDELYKTAKWNLKSNKADLEDALNWEQYQRDTQHYIKAFEKLSNNAKTLIVKHGKKACLEKWGSSADDAMHMRVSIMNATNTIKANRKILEEELPEQVQVDRNWDRKAIAAKIESLEHQYSHAKKFKSGACETCGQSVAVDDPETIKIKYKKEKAKLKALDQYDEYLEAVEKRAKAKKEIRESKEELAELEPKHAKLNRYGELMEEIVNIPNKPAPFTGKKVESKVLQRMVDEDRERIQLLNFIQPNLDTIIELLALSDKQRNAASIGEKLQNKINEIQEKLGKLKLRLALCKAANEDYVRLKARVLEMKTELKDEEALKFVLESYSDKAMKKMAIQSIASRLMLEVNKYAKVVFPEDYTFDFNWDTSQMALTVKRKYGKRNLISDVRKLSGAESKLFTVVLVMALMTFVPKRRRCNVLILDEPTANFSPETTEAFMRLLPALNRIFPSIVIITPKSGERYPNAMEWTVVKTRSEAKLVAGHPSILKAKK